MNKALAKDALRFAIGRSRLERAGFTLIELLVVLAVLGLLMTLVPPLIGAAVPGVELKAAARRSAAGMRLARQEAIRTGRDAAWVLNVDTRSFEVTGSQRRVRLPAGVALRLEAAEREMDGEGSGAIRFFPDSSSTGGVLTLARDGRGYQVGVDWLTGRVRLAPWEEE